MSKSSVKLEIVTPRGVMLETEADEVVVISDQGEVGILPMHAMYITLVRPGRLFYKKGAEITACAVDVGFASVKENALTIATRRYSAADEIDLECMQDDLAEINEKISTIFQAPSNAEFRELDTRRQWLAGCLKAARSA